MEPHAEQNQATSNLYPPPQFSMYPPQPILGPKYDEEYLRHQAELNEKLAKLKTEIEKMPDSDLEQFKDQKLPLARIKKIMKSDEDVRMISAEAPILFAKACEMFIIEMTHKAYYYAKKNNRKTLQRNDIAAAITDTEIYDFLLDIMPRDEIINNAKDKQLSAYQRQLLDDAWNIQQLQSQQLPLPQNFPPGAGVPPPSSGKGLPSSVDQNSAALMNDDDGDGDGAVGQQQQQRELSYIQQQQQQDDDNISAGADDMQQEELKQQQHVDGGDDDNGDDEDEEENQEEGDDVDAEEQQQQQQQLKKQKSSGSSHKPHIKEEAKENQSNTSKKQSNQDEQQQDQDGSDQKRRSQRQVQKKTYK